MATNDKHESGFERVNMCLDPEVLAFIDEQAAKLDRSRSWLLGVLCRRYKASIEKGAERRAKKRREQLDRLVG